MRPEPHEKQTVRFLSRTVSAPVLGGGGADAHATPPRKLAPRAAAVLPPKGGGSRRADSIRGKQLPPLGGSAWLDGPRDAGSECYAHNAASSNPPSRGY